MMDDSRSPIVALSNSRRLAGSRRISEKEGPKENENKNDAVLVHSSGKEHVSARKGSGKSFRGSLDRLRQTFARMALKKGRKIYGQEVVEDVNYDVWLNPTDPELKDLLSDDPREFYLFKRSDSNITITSLISALLIFSFVARGRFDTIFGAGGLFVAGFACGWVLVVAILASLCLRWALLSHDVPVFSMLQPWYDDALSIIHKTWAHYLEDAIVVSISTTTGLYILARTMAGACPPGTSPWDVQTCNPATIVNFIPIDTYVLNTLAPLAAQKFYTGSSKRAVTLAWVINLVLVHISLSVAEAKYDSYIWVNLQYLIVLSISYEIERGFISRFLGKKAEEAMHDKNVKLIMELETAKRLAMESDMASKRSMIRYISHEIRTPLNTIAGSMEALQQEFETIRGRMNPEIFEIVTTCRESCTLARDIISDLISFEKLAAGLYKLEKSSVAVLPYILDVARPFVVNARSKGVDFTFEKFNCTEQVLVSIDPVKMAQVFRNIFSNAVKFTPPEGKVVVTLTSERCSENSDQGLVTIAIKDEGPGLTKHQMGEMFAEGVQFNANKLQGGGGSGLGLYISKGIVKLHDGARLWVESDGEGKGSTFFVSMTVSLAFLSGTVAALGKIEEAEEKSDRDAPARIPMLGPSSHSVVDSAGAAGGAGGGTDTAAGAACVQGLRVLVVDDSKSTRKTLIRLLKYDHHECDESENGLDAFAKIRRMLIARDDTDSKVTSYDAVVIDCNMPKMTGPDAVLEMRRIGFRGPIVGVSGNEDEEDSFLRSGADCMLVKPVERAVLAEALGAAWTKRVHDVNANLHHTVANALSPRPNAGSTSNHGAARDHSAPPSMPNTPRGSTKVSRAPPPKADTPAMALRRTSAAPPTLSHPKRPSRNAGGSQGGGAGLRWTSTKSTPKVAPSQQSQSKQEASSAFVTRGGGGGGEHRAEEDLDAEQIRELVVMSSAEFQDITRVRHTDVFLNFQSAAFRNRDVLAEFKEFRRADWNAYMSVACIVLTFVYVVTRYSLEHLWHLNPAFGATFASLLVYAACLGVNLVCRLAVNSDRVPWAMSLRRHQHSCHQFYATGRGQLLEDAMLVFASLTASLHMVARVVQGACPPDTPMWYQQQCNAEAAAAAVPQEALLTLVVGVLVWQVLFPGATRHALVLAWATAVVATNVCMRIAGSNLYLWNNLGFALVLAVSYEIERFKVNAFIARRLLTLSTELTQAVEASREGIQVERDQQLSVSDELRNTIANAAHDLTSPCTAVGLAVESILENLLQSALRERRTLTSEEARMSDVLWDVYYAMATLHMIINRATDYNKMTATMALKPSQRPTNIRETVHRIISGCGVLRVHGSISKQYSSNLEGEEVHVDNDVGVISLAPISNDVPDVGMTDESWLRDNLLCVVGNAVKHSTGSVHIYIKAVTASGKKMVEIAVQDSGPEKLTSVQLKALFDRPIQFSRESVGGMGVGMYCLIQRSKALGGDAGARLRADNRSGTVVWFRFPFEPCPENLRAIESGLFALRKTYMDTYAGVSAAHSADDDDDSDHGELHGLGHTKVKKPSGLLRLLSQKISNSSLAQSVKSSKQGPDVVATSPHPSPLVRVKKGGQAHVKPSKDALPAVPEGSTMVPISDTLNASDGPLSGLHILAVDDSAAILKMMVRMLSGAGAVVSSAKDGREAVDLFKAAAFDVVVTDIQMPHLDGFGESRAMRLWEKSLTGTARGRRRTKIVGISAKCDPMMSEEATKAGMDHFLPKPFRLTELLAIMQQDAAKGATSEKKSPNVAPPTESKSDEVRAAAAAAAGSEKSKRSIPALDMNSVRRAQALIAQEQSGTAK